MRRLVVFFSWQSDIPDNHSTIKSGLEKACKNLARNWIVKLSMMSPYEEN